MTYKIIRNYFDDNVPRKVMAEGLTLEEAKEWCRDPESSSKTCQFGENAEHTDKYGEWFDGFDEE